MAEIFRKVNDVWLTTKGDANFSTKYVDVPLEINPLNAELKPIRHLLALVGARHIVHVSRIRVKQVLCNTVLSHSVLVTMCTICCNINRT